MATLNMFLFLLHDVFLTLVNPWNVLDVDWVLCFPIDYATRTPIELTCCGDLPQPNSIITWFTNANIDLV